MVPCEDAVACTLLTLGDLPIKIFLSHASADKPFARRIGKDLEALGVEVWIDEGNIRVGESLRQSIERGLAECDYAVVVMSQVAATRRWVQTEIDALFALEAGRNRNVIFPVLIDNVKVSELLGTKRYADFRTEYDDGFQQLKAAISPNDSSWDFVTERTRMTLEFLRVDGSIAKFEKTQVLRAQRDGIGHFVDGYTSDGAVDVTRSSPGEIERIWRSGHVHYVKTRFPRALSMNQRITVKVAATYRNSFLADQEFWDLYQYFPSDEFVLDVKYLKSRPPLELWAIEKRGVAHRTLEGCYVPKKRDGRVTATFRVAPTKGLAHYEFNWRW